jgi:hypothetical protein
MSSLDFDLDGRMSSLESEWRQAYETGIAARAALQAHAASEDAMSYHNADGGPSAELLERRWFAALRAASIAKAECDLLMGVLERAEDAWRRARLRVAELECLRDTLGEELDDLSDTRAGAPEPARRLVLTAA